MELPNSGKKYTALPAGIPPELGGIPVEAGLLCLKSENYALFVDRNSGWKWSNGPEFRDEPMGSVMSSINITRYCTISHFRLLRYEILSTSTSVLDRHNSAPSVGDCCCASALQVHIVFRVHSSSRLVGGQLSRCFCSLSLRSGLLHACESSRRLVRTRRIVLRHVEALNLQQQVYGSLIRVPAHWKLFIRLRLHGHRAFCILFLRLRAMCLILTHLS